ncbi:MAG TPA: hypothetical protein VHA37_01860 [Candidatus Saccharimonadales bacterium]|nr:hypothetical protein [Candidatus Saccharimonadales bacterium]
MQLARGMKSWSTHQLKLKFSDYAVALPLLPKTFGHVGTAQPPVPSGWGMLGNDQYGDCVVAGAAHGLMTWNWATGRQIPQFADQEIVKQYLGLTGGQDDGLDPVEFAAWWKSTGLADAAGKRHQIRSYTAVTDPQQAIEAAYIFGFSGLGLYIPDSAEDQFSNGHVWDDLHSQPAGGHYVPLVGRNSAGNLVVVTWGKLQAMTPEYLNKYFMGGVAYTSEDYMTAAGISPEGFDFTQLDDDMAGIG